MHKQIAWVMIYSNPSYNTVNLHRAVSKPYVLYCIVLYETFFYICLNQKEEEEAYNLFGEYVPWCIGTNQSILCYIEAMINEALK